MSDRLTAPLRAYRIFSVAMTPLTPLLLARRLRRGKEHRLRMPERRGISVMARPPGQLIWLHGASVGELISVLPLIERIRAREINVLVTSGTVTSGGLAEQRLPRDVIHQFVPLDVPMYVRRFLDHWQPDLALFAESDLWPNIIIESARRGVPMILVNGRLSDNSFRRWRYLPVTISNLLARLDLCLARTPADARRLSELGATHVVTTGDLKLDVPAPPADRGKLADLNAAIGGRPVIAAASTHAGEETAVIDAHRRLRASFPSLLTIIVPRHPERGVGVESIARAAGLKTKLRTRRELPDATTDIYVADTVGELGIIYRLSPIVFVGGSLVKRGGQNPIEPAKLGAAILHGPHVWNFTEIYTALDQAHGAETITDASKLTAAFGSLLSQGEARARVANAARTTVDALSGALDRTLQSLDPYLMQLRLRQRADNA
ncbi:MAG TPA: 3-deoxy-D-manno-octulosonic acid transferase [Pseudolabrys sp.]